jgi:uncharacterized protein YciI
VGSFNFFSSFRALGRWLHVHRQQFQNLKAEKHFLLSGELEDLSKSIFMIKNSLVVIV